MVVFGAEFSQLFDCLLNDQAGLADLSAILNRYLVVMLSGDLALVVRECGQ